LGWVLGGTFHQYLWHPLSSAGVDIASLLFLLPVGGAFVVEASSPQLFSLAGTFGQGTEYARRVPAFAEGMGLLAVALPLPEGWSSRSIGKRSSL